MYQKYMTLFAIVAVAFVAGCAEANDLTSTPVITPSTTVVEAGQQVTLEALASDPDDDRITYDWQATGGSFNVKSGSVVTWTSPTESGTYTITVEAKDAQGASSAGSINSVDITVNIPTPGLYAWEDGVDSIDYSRPELYLVSGNQSDLSEQYLNEINQEVRIGSNDISDIETIFNWKEGYFSNYSAGGALIGKVTADQLMDIRALSGCHDHGLVLVSVLRKYGFPAIMVDTAAIQWALDYREGKVQGFRGHIFVEAYVKDKWILIDSTAGRYIENYDPPNPVIPITHPGEPKGHFALFKGLDPEGYGITSNQQLQENLGEFAREVESIEMHFPEYTIKQFRPAGL